ncbi:MAG: amidohydrolase family protein [Eubacterium sp.]|nr:amidohydrolase family protein [Eubacterium sp.]
MIIDTHAHTFPDHIAYGALRKMEQEILNSQNFVVKAARTGTVEDLSKASIGAGIDITLVCPVATNVRQPEKINRLSVELNQGVEEHHLFSLGAIHPECENYKEILDEIVAMDFRGIKLHPDYQNMDFDDERYIRIMDYAANKGLVIITHAGEDVGLPGTVHCTPDKVLNVWKHIQPEKLVLAHMGGWRKWDEVEEKLMDLPVYFDTAVCGRKDIPVHISDEQLVRMIRNHGVERVLFGTDSPWYDQKEALDDLKNSGLTEAELKLVLGENAKKLFQF